MQYGNKCSKKRQSRIRFSFVHQARTIEAQFCQAAAPTLNVRNITKDTFRRTFQGLFGMSPQVCAFLWLQLALANASLKKLHLLWTLCFLKTYCTESVLSSLFKTDPKTLRKWIWQIVPILEELKLVSWIIFIIITVHRNYILFC